jgi:flagellar protein FliO/FliZ
MAASFLVTCLAAPAAHAVTALRQVQVSNGSQIDLLFDGKVQKSQIRTEFVNDIIQLSIQDVSVYPAKISAVNGASLTKIFAYQYAPRLVRCRLTVKGKAEDFRDKLEIKAGGRILTIRMEGLAQVAPGKAGDNSPAARAGVTSKSDAEERALLSRVIAASNAPAQAPAAAPAKEKDKDTIASSAAAPARESTENRPVRLTGEASARLTGGKALPSPLKAFGKMGIVLALFGLLAFALKRYASSRSGARVANASALQAAASKGGWLGALGQLAKKGLGGRNSRMIEVLSTHYLGPKKSIAVVRVAGRVLVLGVSNESINLITQLSGEDAAAGLEGLDLADLVGPSVGAAPAARAPGRPQPEDKVSFGDLLSSERSRPQTQGYAAYAAGPALPAGNSNANVRAQIRSRLEGLKTL